MKVWFELLLDFPPGRLRLFARKGPNSAQRLKTRADIARDGGLAESTVSKIVDSPSFAGFKFSTIVRYIRGCGVDPLNLGETKRYFRRRDRKRAYYSRMTRSQRAMAARVLNLDKAGR